MNILIDAILVILLLICIFVGHKRGFIKTIIKLFSGIISFAVAVIFSPLLSPVFYEKIYYKFLQSTISEKLSSYIEFHGTDALFSNSGESAGLFNEFLSKFGSNLEVAREHFAESAGQSVSAFCDSFASTLAEPIAETISYVTAFLILFIVCSIILKILSSVLGLVAKLPLIKTADKLLGTLAGICVGLFWCCAISAIIDFAFPYISVIAPDFFPAETLQNTSVYKFIHELNLLNKIFELVL